ncbi:hypothetical protein [Alistipes ihumii]|uniref:hypothetical protein n=1 Tax=Alistipes ihumii TaxID=1470347 RepID=UPI0026666592|nr:hypothetical protein [Alistipes ihumii]
MIYHINTPNRIKRTDELKNGYDEKGNAVFFAVPFIMIMVAFTCTKDEGPDCHKRITVKNASEIPLYVVNELFYNWTSVPTYPGRYVLIDISDTVTRKQYLVPPLTLDSDVVSTEGICYEQRIRESPGGACLKIFFIDARMVDSLNTLDKLIEHNKEICLGTRTFRTMDEMREANFTVTYQ